MLNNLRKRRIVYFAVFVAFICVGMIAAPKCAKAEATYTLKLGHLADPKNPYALGGERFADLVKERTDGKVVIKLFPNSQLGKAEKLIEGVVLGTIDFCMTTTAVLGQFEPKLLVFGFPYIFRDRDHAFKALDTIGFEVGKSLEKKGIKILGFYENGLRHMINNKRKLNSPDDMKGLKIRVMATPVYIEMIKSLGADPTPMAFGEVYSACQQGTIDGLECPAVHFWQMRFFEVNKYITLTAHTYESEPLVMSMKSWNKLPEKYQKIMLQAVKESLIYSRKLSIDEEAGFFQKIRETGKCAIDEVDTAPFAEKSKIVWKKLESKVGKDLIEKIQNVK
ncbi:MAG: TRAP transporter substrate-binding protein [Deltaproteobacteria bacterium]|nr:TRAP transporter substrate-binding protein [Deltaproteobacteria bacterium]